MSACRTSLIAASIVLICCVSSASAQSYTERYPCPTAPLHGPGTCGPEDVYRLRNFRFSLGPDFILSTQGGAEVVVGQVNKCAVWAAVFLDEPATISAPGLPGDGEVTEQLWLHFAPGWLPRLIRERTMDGPGDPLCWGPALELARHCWPGASPVRTDTGIVDQAVWLDVVTSNGEGGSVRRAYRVEAESGKASYQPSLEGSLPPVPESIEDPGSILAEFRKLTNPSLSLQLAERARDSHQLAGALSLVLPPDSGCWVRTSCVPFPLPGTDWLPRLPLKEDRTASPRLLDQQVGYLPLTHLTAETPEEVDEALEQLRSSRALIIDLRGSWGFEDEVALEIASRFLDEEKPIALHHKGRDKGKMQYFQPRGERRYFKPVSVLQDEGMAGSAQFLMLILSHVPGVRIYGSQTQYTWKPGETRDLGHGIEVYFPSGTWTADLSAPIEGLSGPKGDATVGSQLDDPLLARALADLKE